MDEQPRLSDCRYRFGEPIGVGGMGEVLLARDNQLGRDVAVKRLRSANPSHRQVARFLREARIQGRLAHPAIPPVHELGWTSDGQPYFAMKRLAGTTLQEILSVRDKRFTLQRLLRAFADVCFAVEFAHVHGVIHRDLKPANIMVGDLGEVYVLDWGIAKVIGEADSFDDISYDGLASDAGDVVGTRSFMSPEQDNAEADVDARADVYSLGRVLEEILAAQDNAPPELAAAVASATVADRAARLATPRELGDLVQRYLDSDRDHLLAAEHLARARTAFAAGDALRRTAMREAGRALSLDPEQEGAAELIGRLTTEPPRAIAASSSRPATGFGPAPLATVLALLALTSLMVWQGQALPMALLDGGLAIAALVFTLRARR